LNDSYVWPLRYTDRRTEGINIALCRAWIFWWAIKAIVTGYKPRTQQHYSNERFKVGA